jgi:hypothetical protein
MDGGLIRQRLLQLREVCEGFKLPLLLPLRIRISQLGWHRSSFQAAIGVQREQASAAIHPLCLLRLLCLLLQLWLLRLLLLLTT